MEIYLKPNKKVSIVKNRNVLIKDIADVFAPPNLLKKVKNIKLIEIKSSKKKKYLITIIDIIEAIDTALPGHTINNVGETDTVIEFQPEEKKRNKAFDFLKITFVSIVLFTGSSTAIMSFHSDSQMATVFENYYYIFFNEKIENPMIIDLPYSIGLAIGIIVFFNHFSGKKITDDPTPIEVEMSTYENNVTDNIIDTLNIEKSKKGGNNDSD